MIRIAKNVFICDKCGKEIEYIEGDHIYESCWRFSPNHYRAGYGSRFDGSQFTLDICDDCLWDFVETFKNKEIIHNSGSNYYCEDNECGYEDDEEAEASI